MTFKSKITLIISTIMFFGLSLTVTADTSKNSDSKYIIKDYVCMSAAIAIIAILIIVFFLIYGVRYSTLNKQKKALSEANIKLEKASAAKTDFLSRMSHDIKTPLNAIIGITNLALDETNNPDMMKKYLTQIESSSEFLLGLINDILDMSKIENKAIVLNPEPYLISDFVEQLDLLIRPLCEKKHIEFVFEAKDVSFECVKLDKLRFNQIFFNLLSNAVKFTCEGGKIELIVLHLEHTNNIIKKKFIIRDNGIGMSDEFIKQMFEPFTQERNALLNTSLGTGLGLPIVKNLVELMNGTISVKSELGKGTEFTIYLETEVCDAPEKTDVMINNNNDILYHKKILLFEDNEINTEIAIAMLNKKGIKTDVASNGKIGTEMFMNSANGYYDAILMDILMPVMNGLEATKTIRAMDRKDAQTIPIIAMTANAFDDDVKKSKEAGMNAHLAKPISPQNLYETLSNIISESKNK